ncbi:hypothetical protein KEJ25_06650, partial [Candidatus Bathyarchaeota archaeon]|nr:hypothetical protein [Candidatus Bathyarchaeota archaeon]
KRGELYTLVSKISVKPYAGTVYNLEVDRWNSYTTESFVVHNCRGLHGEENCIIQAAVFGVSTKGAVLYCTHFPCSICAKMIINAEIAEVVYEHEYNDELSKRLLAKSGVKVRIFQQVKR